jgi:predicted nucleic-acid-binding Zn-ribbon protein
MILRLNKVQLGTHLNSSLLNDVCKYEEFYEQAKSADFGQILDTKRHFSEVIG